MRGACPVVCAIAIAGCFSPTTTTCADGTTCPAAKQCAPAGGGCVDPSQIAACVGLDDDANCTAVADGACQQGVCLATRWDATAVIGDVRAATAIVLGEPRDAAVDRSGNLFVADSTHHRIVRIDASGELAVVAGTGEATAMGAFDGDGGAATAATLDDPTGIAVDGLGDLYIADSANHRVRRIDTAGIITTIAGTGAMGFNGDVGPAATIELSTPSGVAVDGLGNVFIADTDNNRLREIDGDGMITTLLGSNGELLAPTGVAFDGRGAIAVADSGHDEIWVRDAKGAWSVVAGNGTAGFSGDGGPGSAAELSSPQKVAFDAAGDLYIADSNNERIREIASGVITTVAGNGSLGFAGDGSAATAAEFDLPSGVTVDAAGELYVTDTLNHRVRSVTPGATITTVAGTGANLVGDDGGAATCAQLGVAFAAAVDGSGALYFTDTNGARVRRVGGDGVITTVVGTDEPGYTGDGGPATAAQIDVPEGLSFDGLGDLYVVDSFSRAIRRVDRDGVITTVASGGPFVAPRSVVAAADGSVLVADPDANEIWRIDAAGVVTAFAGTGSPGFGGDGGPAASAALSEPSGLAIASDGSVYIADRINNRIRRVDASGVISTVVGTGSAALFSDDGDGSAAIDASVVGPLAVAFDAQHALYIADTGHGSVRRVDANGVITTVAGAGLSGVTGDGGPATKALLQTAIGVAVDAAGAVYSTELGRIRRVDPATGTITTVVGPIDPGQMGPVAQARLADPRALVITPLGTLFAGGSSGTVQARFANTVATIVGRYPQPIATGALARFRDFQFSAVTGVAFDASAGVIYLTESTANRVDAVTVTDVGAPDTWTIAPIANGSGAAGFGDGAAITASFREPTGLYFDAGAHVLYVADTGNHAIRAIDLTMGIAAATVSTVAGTPAVLGELGDGGPATAALLDAPQAITRCGDGDLFVADTGNNRVRRIAAATQIISTVLGDGSVSSSGEGSPASSFPVDAPLNLACDAVGNLFVTSSSTVRMVLAGASGVVDGTGAVRTIYGLPPRDLFPASVTRCLAGLAVVDTATVEVTDSCTGIQVELARTTLP